MKTILNIMTAIFTMVMMASAAYAQISLGGSATAGGIAIQGFLKRGSTAVTCSPNPCTASVTIHGSTPGTNISLAAQSIYVSSGVMNANLKATSLTGAALDTSSIMGSGTMQVDITITAGLADAPQSFTNVSVYSVPTALLAERARSLSSSVSTATTFTNTITIGTLAVTTDASVGGNQTVTGNLTVSGNISGNFTGNPTFANNATISGTLTSSQGVTVTAGGATVTAGGITVNGGGLTVNTGDGTFANNATVAGTLTAPIHNGNTTFNNNATVSGTLTAANVAGNTTFANNVTVTGTLSASGVTNGTGTLAVGTTGMTLSAGGTAGTAIKAMGVCNVTQAAIGTVSVATTCTGIPTGTMAAVWCSPTGTLINHQAVSWRHSAANTVVVRATGTITSAPMFSCFWALP